MDNEKKMVDMAAEIVENLMEEKKKAGKMPENAVRLEMTPGKIRAFAALFPRPVVENSVGMFLSGMVKDFYGRPESGDAEDFILIKRAMDGDEQAQKIIGTMHLLAEVISYDLKGEQYDWDDDEE